MTSAIHRAAAIALLLGASSCVSELGGFECSGDPSCDVGERCIDRACAHVDPACGLGYRWSSTAGDRAETCAEIDADAAALDGAADLASRDLSSMDLPACGKTSCIHDDFDDGVRAAIWQPNSYATGGVTVNESGGLLVITPPQQSGASGFAAYMSAQYDLTESQVVIEVVKTSSVVSDTTYLALTHEALHDWFQIQVTGGMLSAQETINGQAQTLGTTPYDAALHLWWRIRETGGMTFFETNDGASLKWSMLAVAPTPSFANQVSIEIGAGLSVSTDGGAGEAEFDNFNLPAM